MVGLGGTGKSTFANILTTVVGEKNVVTTGLNKINKEFELVNIMGKK